MKSKRRHELQQNTLDAELGKAFGWLRGHGTKLALGLLVIAVGALGVSLYKRHTRTRIAEVQAQYEKLRVQSMSADSKPDDVISGFRDLSQQTTIPWIAADSLVRIGNINLALMTVEDEAQARQQYGTAAADAYQQVLAKWQEQPPAIGAAQVGLARIAETRGDYEAARTRYEQVANNPQLNGYPIADIARQSLRDLAGMQQPVRLAATLPSWAQEDDPQDAPTDGDDAITQPAEDGETADAPEPEGPPAP